MTIGDAGPVEHPTEPFLQQRAWVRHIPAVAIGAPVAFAVLWILFFARGTSAGAAVSEPGEFFVAFLNGVTLAGLLFVVASGFTLIFGLMRTVNMAHGSLFLLAAYIGIDLQKQMVGKTRNINADDVSILQWVVPMLVGAAVVAVIGVVMQQVFLRWNQGEELRQALITLAISVILADQMLREFGGLAQTMVWPGRVTHFIDIFGQRYATSRLFMLGVALLVGALLWLWLNKTRMGMVIRAGVDDQDMVRALGINITLVFAATFFVGAFLAGMGGAMGASFAGASTGADGAWLLNSLVVVIIGGLGSVKGALAGSLLYGMVLALSPVYLPSEYAFYSIIFTFVLLALVLAVRPYGLFGKVESA
ncbi:MAG: branched-chain amino acid ABC transporter permease [Acidimicrobiia bacterium]|nr:branched-chain amino acid ABC transporter permease [Acidimicrobiia bacterium]